MTQENVQLDNLLGLAASAVGSAETLYGQAKRSVEDIVKVEGRISGERFEIDNGRCMAWPGLRPIPNPFVNWRLTANV